MRAEMLFDMVVEEFSGSIFLKADTLYPFQVEYFEGVGAAVCQLFWSSDNVTRSVVPQSQLYPFFEEEPEEPGDTTVSGSKLR